MSTPEPGPESTNAETAATEVDWRAPRTWVFFVADAAYGGAATGLIVIVACLITGLFYELKMDGYDGWWLVIIVTVLLSAIHLIIFDRWLLPGISARQFELDQALPGDGNSVKLGSYFYGFGMAGTMSLLLPAQRLMLSSLYYGLRVAAGIGLVFIARELTAPPDAWKAQMLAVMIFSILNNECTLLKLLAYRTPNDLGS